MLSDLAYETSCWVFSLSGDVSDAISIVNNTSAHISSFLSSVSSYVSNDLSVFKVETSTYLSDFFDKSVVPIKTIVGLSTLDYYTFIGDDISKVTIDPELS